MSVANTLPPTAVAVWTPSVPSEPGFEQVADPVARARAAELWRVAARVEVALDVAEQGPQWATCRVSPPAAGVAAVLGLLPETAGLATFLVGLAEWPTLTIPTCE